MAQFKVAHPDTPVATTEPVGDYMLEAAGAKNMTPFTLQADDHERHRPGPSGRDPAEQRCSRDIT